MDILNAVSSVCSILGFLVSLFVAHRTIKISKSLEKNKKTKKVKQIAIGGRIGQRAGDTYDSTSCCRK